MPIYEYECLECNNHFEFLLKNSNDSVSCSKCHSDHVRRKLSKVAAPVIHGSGKSACEHASVCPGATAGSCGCGCAGHKHH